MKLETAGKHARMANSPDILESTDLFDIGLLCESRTGQVVELQGLVMTGKKTDPAEGHYSLLIGNDRSRLNLAKHHRRSQA
jgi:hypothetical protein